MKNLIIIFLFGLSECISAQPGFNRSYDLGELAAAFSSIELSNDTIIVYGTARETGSPAFGMLFVRLDTFGNLIDYKIYNDSLEDDFTLVYPNSFIKVSDGSGYAGVGQIFYRQNGYIARFDNEGSLLYIKDIVDGSSEVDFFYQIIEITNGFMIAGLKFRWVGELELFVMKTDKYGNKLWEKNYGNVNRNDLFGSILPLNLNEYVIAAGTTSLQGTSLPQTLNTSKIFAIDSVGTVKWSWESSPSLEEMGAAKVYKTQDSNWLYMSARGWYNPTYNEISRQPKLIIRDTNFNLIREDTFGIADSPVTLFLNTIQLNDGGWLGVGMKPVNYPVSPIDPFANSLSGWIYRMNSQADKVWNRVDTAFWSPQTGSTNHLYDAVELPSGSIIVCGSSRTYDPVVKDWGWLIKISPDGCVDTLSCAMVSTASPPQPSPGFVKMYPNPTMSVVNIQSTEPEEWDRIEVINAAGQLLQSQVRFYGNQLDMSGLEDGIYFIRLTKDGEAVTKKVVKRQ